MRLMVCPRLGVTRFHESPVTHFVSLIDPDERETPLQAPKSTTHTLRLIFNDLDDIEKTLPMFARYSSPDENDVARLVAFGHAMESLPDWGLLVHCEAGISRSTASAITIITAAGYHPAIAFGMVRRACPAMLPNRRMLRMADDLLKTKGALCHMAEVHRRKAFLRAGYEDPTLTRQREAKETAAGGPARRGGRPGFFRRLFARFLGSPKISQAAPRQPVLLGARPAPPSSQPAKTH
jgi:predicted protein tyrosine phosphatase